MTGYRFITLRERPERMRQAAEWFHSKWGVPTEAYLECMEAYLKRETELGWFLCLEGDRIVGGLGVIENDFHDRPDLTPSAPCTRKKATVARASPGSCWIWLWRICGPRASLLPIW